MFWPEGPDAGPAAVIAVADGHGSRKAFRSDRGSRFAVEVAVEQLRTYVPEALAAPDGALALRREAAVDLPQRIVREWRRLVDDHLAAVPVDPTELSELTPSEQAGFDADPRSAYGSTLVAAVMLPGWAVFLQLGDGDVLVVGDETAEPDRPIEADPRSFANATASLAPPGASPRGRRPDAGSEPWTDFRVRVVPTVQNPPALVLLTTDGYPNAFVNDAAFRKAASDFLSLGRSEGWGYVTEHLPGWLQEASRKGSGDDVTVALLIREGDPTAGSGGASDLAASAGPPAPEPSDEPRAQAEQA